MLKSVQMISIFLLITVSVFSREFQFEYIGIEHGLSDPTVSGIYQDEKNRMWFATHDGLNCYDGNTLREFRQQTENGVTINAHRIIEITGDKNGHIYLRLAYGVIEFDLKTEKMRLIVQKAIHSFYFNAGCLWTANQNTIECYDTQSQKIKANFYLSFDDIRISSIFDDNEGHLWITSYNKGLIRLSIAKKQAIEILKQTYGRKIMKDRDGNLWYTTLNEGVFKINPKNLQTIKNFRHNPANESTINSGTNRAITEDNKGNIWIGSSQGLACIAYKTEHINRFKKTGYTNALTSSSILSLYTDNRGTVWIGTYFGGVNYFNPSSQNYNYIASSSNNQPTYPAIGTIAEDRYGTIWVGTEGGGLYRYNPAKQNIFYFNTSNSALSSNYIKKIVPDPYDDVLWVAADQTGNLNSIDPKSGIISTHPIDTKSTRPLAFFAVAASPKILYLGSSYGVIAYDKTTEKASYIYRQIGQFTSTSNDLILDSKGRLWFAISNYPVSYSVQTAELTYYTYNINYSKSESSVISNIFYEDKKGNIWLGTNGYGLLLLNESNKSFDYEENFTQLRDKSIMAIAETKQNNMVISTIQALYFFNPRDKSLSKQTYQNGFPLKSLIKRGLYVSKTGDIYMGGIPTLVIYQEKNLIPANKPDKIQLTSLIVNNKEVHPGDQSKILKHALPFTSEITLNPNQNFITLMFSTDNYYKTNDDRIQYQLKGYDKQWNDVNLGNAITYTSLSPGRYSFEIRSKDNIENVRILKIRVKPPFYATFWAYLLYIIILSIVIYYLVREYHTRISLRASLAYRDREKQQIEEMNQSKIRFFINVSHEIRTPITLVLAQTETLLNMPNLHSKTRNKIMNIHRHLLSLKHLVTELMDFRKQEQGQLKLKYSEIDLVSMLREHYNLFKGLAESKDIEFSFLTTIPKLPVWVDGEQMVKVINNMTINALKFTEAGGSVTLNLDEIADRAVLSIKDTGIGIPKNDLNQIFNRFYQAENTAGGGTGIGLSLVKSIVEAHRGTVTVESTEGEGSTFLVSLPLGKAHVPAEQMTESKSAMKEQYQIPDAKELTEFIEKENGGESLPEERPVVLIVEDNDELRELLKNTLSNSYKIETAADGVEGWDKVRTTSPNLVITDVMMPRMSGVDLCARIKKNYELCHIPVILLTARQSAEYEIEGLRLGADSYLTKPFEIKKLIVVSNNLINSRRLIQKKFEQTRKFDIEIPATNEFDKEFIHQVTTIIQQNMEDENFDVDVLARETGVSRTKLFGRIKTIAGTTPNSLIQDMRLKRAADYLLNNPEMNVADISYQLCFNSPRYFNKCFKEAFGVAPMHFKKENKK